MLIRSSRRKFVKRNCWKCTNHWERRLMVRILIWIGSTRGYQRRTSIAILTLFQSERFSFSINANFSICQTFWMNLTTGILTNNHRLGVDAEWLPSLEWFPSWQPFAYGIWVFVRGKTDTSRSGKLVCIPYGSSITKSQNLALTLPCCSLYDICLQKYFSISFHSHKKKLIKPTTLFSLTKNYFLSENTFDTLDAATRARDNLNGADIYSGCCTLKIDFAKVSI